MLGTSCEASVPTCTRVLCDVLPGLMLSRRLEAAAGWGLPVCARGLGMVRCVPLWVFGRATCTVVLS